MYNEINEVIDVRFRGWLNYDVGYDAKQIGEDMLRI